VKTPPKPLQAEHSRSSNSSLFGC